MPLLAIRLAGLHSEQRAKGGLKNCCSPRPCASAPARVRATRADAHPRLGKEGGFAALQGGRYVSLARVKGRSALLPRTCQALVSPSARQCGPIKASTGTGSLLISQSVGRSRAGERVAQLGGVLEAVQRRPRPASLCGRAAAAGADANDALGWARGWWLPCGCPVAALRLPGRWLKNGKRLSRVRHTPLHCSGCCRPATPPAAARPASALAES